MWREIVPVKFNIMVHVGSGTLRPIIVYILIETGFPHIKETHKYFAKSLKDIEIPWNFIK